MPRSMNDPHPWEELFKDCGAYYLQYENEPCECIGHSDFISINTLELFTTKANGEKNIKETIDENPDDYSVAYASGTELLKMILRADTVEIDETDVSDPYIVSLAGLCFEQFLCDEELEFSSLKSIRDALMVTNPSKTISSEPPA